MKDLTFKEIVNNIQAMKSRYKRVLSLFSCGFDIKKKNNYIYQTKIEIYSLFKETWKSDRIWNYMNDDLSYEELLEIANRQNTK
jgi:hypothetical protein